MAQSTPANKEFDIVVFGATGFTGGYIVREMQETCGTVRSWAIAGRTRSKLNSLHEELGLSESVGVIQATVDEEESIREMCKRADLVINCVGPYAVYRGDMVTRLCIEEGSCYVDLTGEIDFLELMRDKYNQLAEENGVFVIPACGYVSMVPELAINCALETMTSSQLSCVDLYQIFKNVSMYKSLIMPGITMMYSVRQIDGLNSYIFLDGRRAHRHMAFLSRCYVQMEENLSADDTDGEDTSFFLKTRHQVADLLQIKLQ